MILEWGISHCNPLPLWYPRNCPAEWTSNRAQVLNCANVPVKDVCEGVHTWPSWPSLLVVIYTTAAIFSRARVCVGPCVPNHKRRTWYTPCWLFTSQPKITLSSIGHGAMTRAAYTKRNSPPYKVLWARTQASFAYDASFSIRTQQHSQLRYRGSSVFDGTPN